MLFQFWVKAVTTKSDNPMPHFREHSATEVKEIFAQNVKYKQCNQ